MLFTLFLSTYTRNFYSFIIILLLFISTLIILPFTCAFIILYLLTHYCLAMPFGKRNIYLRGSFQFSIVTV